MPKSGATIAFREARDTILTFKGRLDEAVAAFRWPDVGERFNWAVDWFDVIAERNDRTALVILEEDGRRTERSFAELAARSNQVARLLAAQGVSKGDSVLLMVGNQVELWETMLAVMKLGAVIVPTTPALGEADLVDRMDRAQGRCVVATPRDTGKFDAIPGDFLKVVIGEAAGWTSYGLADGESTDALPHPETAPSDRLLLYFTSGTTSRPKLVEHTQASYPIGHLTTVFWIGLEPGDVHCNISSPGWA